MKALLAVRTVQPADVRTSSCGIKRKGAEKQTEQLKQPGRSSCPTVWEAVVGEQSAHHLNCVALRAPPRHSVRVPCPPGVLIRCAPEMDDSKAQYENRLCEEG